MPELLQSARLAVEKGIAQGRTEAYVIIKHGRENRQLCSYKYRSSSSSILPEEWLEILPFVFQCGTSSNAKFQEFAFLIFTQLAQIIGDLCIPHVKDLHAVFLQVLNHFASPGVRIVVLNAVMNFIQCLNCAADWDRFQDLLPAMMKTLTEALNGTQKVTAQEALELLIELAGTEPQFLRIRWMWWGPCCRLLEAQNLEEGTHHLAIEFVITQVEARERSPG